MLIQTTTILVHVFDNIRQLWASLNCSH